jgi:hypothetical protein
LLTLIISHNDGGSRVDSRTLADHGGQQFAVDIG